ncbi:hypothetical protein HZZ13_13585 [Bradyrhizobium sp. CNPSo 4010]|uniref:Uncharacterized protein n=1 Tax=Bradyrhizobium agreste TaxID=2751811 RepID=A0ABS0PNM6_9BRAD|nr:hypothetical protein [Bradyrhizobium agreste]MBH5398814.1 hypothetical protein [Bradyrhizobium agreste]
MELEQIGAPQLQWPISTPNCYETQFWSLPETNSRKTKNIVSATFRACKPLKLLNILIGRAA